MDGVHSTLPCQPVCQHPACWQAKEQAEQRARRRTDASRAVGHGNPVAKQHHRSPGAAKHSNGQKSEKYRSRFALPRRSELEQRHNAAIAYVERNRTSSSPHSSGIYSNTASYDLESSLPQLTLRTLNEESRLPPDPLYSNRSQSRTIAPTTPNKNGLMKGMEGLTLGCPLKRPAVPPKLATLSIQCNADTDGQKAGYVWSVPTAQQLPAPAHHWLPGTGYYWNASNASFENFPYTPSVMSEREPMTSPTRRGSLRPAAQDSRLDRHTPYMLTEQPRGDNESPRLPPIQDNSKAAYQPTSPSRLPYVKRVKSSKTRQQRQQVKQLATGTARIPPPSAALKDSSSHSVLHNSRRIRPRTPTIKWCFMKIDDTSQQPQRDGVIHQVQDGYSPQYYSPYGAGNPPASHTKQKNLNVIDVGPDLMAGSLPRRTVPKFLANMLAKTKAQEDGTKKKEQDSAPTAVFGSDLYLMAPTARNSPTPAQFSDEWLPPDTSRLQAPPQKWTSDRSSSESRRSETDWSFASTSLPSMGSTRHASFATTPAPHRQGGKNSDSGHPLPQSVQEGSHNDAQHTTPSSSKVSREREQFMEEYFSQGRFMTSPSAPHQSPTVAGLDLAGSIPPPAPSPALQAMVYTFDGYPIQRVRQVEPQLPDIAEVVVTSTADMQVTVQGDIGGGLDNHQDNGGDLDNHQDNGGDLDNHQVSTSPHDGNGAGHEAVVNTLTEGMQSHTATSQTPTPSTSNLAAADLPVTIGNTTVVTSDPMDVDEHTTVRPAYAVNVNAAQEQSQASDQAVTCSLSVSSLHATGDTFAVSDTQLTISGELNDATSYCIPPAVQEQPAIKNPPEPQDMPAPGKGSDADVAIETLDGDIAADDESGLSAELASSQPEGESIAPPLLDDLM